MNHQPFLVDSRLSISYITKNYSWFYMHLSYATTTSNTIFALAFDIKITRLLFITRYNIQTFIYRNNQVKMYLKIRFVIWYIYFLSHIQEAQKPMLWRKKIKYVIIFCNPWSICMQERTFIFPSRNPSTAFIACFLTSSSPFEMQKNMRKRFLTFKASPSFLMPLICQKHYLHVVCM